MSHLRSKSFIAITLTASVGLHAARASETEIVAGLSMGTNQAAVQAILDEHCGSVSVVTMENARYPLARTSEVHLVCDGYEGGPVGFDRAALVIADGSLVQMEAHGAIAESVSSALGEPDGVYLEMNNYQDGTYWFNEANHRLFWLSDDARHPNLFAWSNPNLGASTAAEENNSTLIPDLLDFSGSLEDLRPLFKEQCQQMVVHESERVWLPNQPENQVQIDCFGFPFAGFERKFEAVFGDGKLEVIWVLTGKQEESRLRDQLVRDRRRL